MQQGAASGSAGSSHDGVEMGYVLTGEAELEIGGRQVRLVAGDSVSFSSMQPHRLKNSGGGPFRAVWSVSPPRNDYIGELLDAVD